MIKCRKPFTPKEAIQETIKMGAGLEVRDPFPTQPGDDQKCKFTNKQKLDAKPLGKGGYGMVCGFEGCSDYIVKKPITKSSKSKDRTPKIVEVGDKIIINDDRLLEFIMTNVTSALLTRHKSINFYCISSLLQCNDGALTLIPRFSGDLRNLFKLETKELFEYNLDFCNLSVLHALVLLQKHFKINHRDLKPENVFVQDITKIKWYDTLFEKEVFLTDYAYLELDFGDGYRFYFETSKVKYIPLIGDYGFIHMYLPGATICSHDSSGMVEDVGGLYFKNGKKEYGVPEKFSSWYDSYFYLMYTSFAMKSKTKHRDYKWFEAPLTEAWFKWFFDYRHEINDTEEIFDEMFEKYVDRDLLERYDPNRPELYFLALDEKKFGKKDPLSFVKYFYNTFNYYSDQTLEEGKSWINIGIVDDEQLF